MILDKFPSAEDFYKTYWNKKPFVVRNAIPLNLFESLIDGDTLAGLSLDEDIKSRIVTTIPKENNWVCEHGPFDENKFSKLGEHNWSLLVQNVEQYHTDTSKLLEHFNFSPRWLMDDIMVSYSAIGGTVGPHTDSYHVFLVQGMGKRKWNIGQTPIENEEYVDNKDLKVLKNSFEGEEVEVSIGDVIYIPPHFGHEGKTIEEAMTFSVGFLGPQLSDMLMEYGHYMEEEQKNNRYSGQGLDKRSSAFCIDPSAISTVQNNLVEMLQSDNFSIWMAQYFSTPTHDEAENIEPRETPLSSEALLEMLQDGQVLYRPEYIKLAITTSSDGTKNLSIYGQVISMSAGYKDFIYILNNKSTFSIQEINNLDDPLEVIALITHLYNQNALSFHIKDMHC